MEIVNVCTKGDWAAMTDFDMPELLRIEGIKP